MGCKSAVARYLPWVCRAAAAIVVEIANDCYRPTEATKRGDLNTNLVESAYCAVPDWAWSAFPGRLNQKAKTVLPLPPCTDRSH